MRIKNVKLLLCSAAIGISVLFVQPIHSYADDSKQQTKLEKKQARLEKKQARLEKKQARLEKKKKAKHDSLKWIKHDTHPAAKYCDENGASRPGKAQSPKCAKWRLRFKG